MNVKSLRLLVVVGAGLLPVAYIVMTGDEAPGSGVSIAPPHVLTASALVAVAPSRLVTAASLEAPNGTATDPPIAPSSPVTSARDGEAAVRLSVSGPAFVEAGTQHELVVAVAAPRHARWVDLTISANPDLLELIAAMPGHLGAREGSAPTFEARLSEADNRIVIRAEAGGQTSGNETAGVVIVRFVGVAPGSASITVSGIAVSDLAGNAIPVASPSSEVQVEVMSGPI